MDKPASQRSNEHTSFPHSSFPPFLPPSPYSGFTETVNQGYQDRVTELHGCQTKVNFFVLLRDALLVFCWYVKFSRWIGEVWIQEIIRARLDTCLRLQSIDEVVSPRCKFRKTGE